MKLLVLGGTLFQGRHVVEAALERGHDVTLFNRGRTNPDLFSEVERVQGDRDGDLTALTGREWDAAVDPSGYVPRVVRASAEVLADAVGYYAFVSSVSAYRDFEKVGIAEDYPLAELREESEDVDAHYGPLKAACEGVVLDVFGERALVIRPGVIVGPYDWTNRFGYWARRVAAGGEVLVPAGEWLVQVVHGRDLAEWMLDLAETRTPGVFNAVTRPLPMLELLEEMRAVSGSDARFVPVDDHFLLEQGVEPWDELPLWLATSANPTFAGMMAVDVSRAEEAGLRHRPPSQTIADTRAWEERPMHKEYGPKALAAGLGRERERELLAAWATLKS